MKHSTKQATRKREVQAQEGQDKIPDCILVPESELRVMAGLAALYGNTETGGDLFGLTRRDASS